MINKTFQLHGEDARLTTYILDDGELSKKGAKHKAVIVCPGGGYTYCSSNEGEPVALLFNRHGIHAFVLNYSTKINNPFPRALKELAEAMCLVKEHMEEWRISEINVIGFSAGGNLAFSLGCFYNSPIIATEEQIKTNYLKPAHIILGYPALTLEPKREGELPKDVLDKIEKGIMPDFRGPNIREILLGKLNPSKEEMDKLNLLQYIHKDMPPVFAFGSYEDTVIKPTDIIGLGQKLIENNVECEIHLFNRGPHGVSICDETVKDKDEIKDYNMRKWTKLCLNWLEGN